MPTPVFVCGAECGVNAVGAAGGTGVVKHWDLFTGAITVDTGTFRSPGVRSYKATTAGGAQNYLSKNCVASTTIVVARFYVYFPSLPSANCEIFACNIAAGSYCTVVFQASDSTLRGGLYTSPLSSTGFVVTTGQWYCVDVRGDCSGGTRTTDVTVNGTALTQVSAAQAASTISTVRFGLNASSDTTANGTLYLDDMCFSYTSGDYPLGAGAVVGLYPNADGTHNYNAAGDFQYNGSTNVPTGATDTYSYLDDVLDNITDFISIVAAANTEYLEWQFADTPSDVASINAVNVVGAFHAAGTAANKTTLRLNDNGTLNDVATDLDFSNTTITYHEKVYATAPSTSVAWTKTRVDALRARGNSSYGTVDESPVPHIDGICLEVDYVQTTGPQPLMPVVYSQAVSRAAEF